MPTINVTEALETFNARAVAEKPGVFRIDLITPGWGSSGYYAASVLEQAATDAVFAAGTHMYLDHQTAIEQMDRPEGSVMNLAAVLMEDATWNGTALTARARVFSSYAPALAEMRESIGVSIRASAEVSQGEAEGRRGQIIERLVDATSVDFVTKAGRGGRISEVLENALGNTLTREAALARLKEARNVGHWIESRLHLELTRIADDMFGDGRLTREERISLSSAIGQALTTFASQLETEQPQIYSRDLWEEPTAFLAAAENARANPAGQNHTQESKEDTMATTQIEESELSGLREKAGRVTTLEAERDTAVQRAETAESELKTYKAAEAAAQRESALNGVIEAADVEFTQLEAAGLRAQAVEKDGALDLDGFKTLVGEAVAEKKKTIEGDGSVRSFGHTKSTTDTSEATLREANDTQRAEIFGRSTKEA